MSIHRSTHRLLGCAALAVGLLATTACVSRTEVDLETAQAPDVRPADGAGGQNDAGVIGAGVIEIDDLPRPITTPAPATTQTDAPTTSRAVDQPDDDQAGNDQAGTDQAAAMIAELCADDQRTLLVAVDDYRAEFNTPPTSELDLMAAGYIYDLSDVYDVRVDGSIVPTDSTCTG